MALDGVYQYLPPTYCLAVWAVGFKVLGASPTIYPVFIGQMLPATVSTCYDRVLRLYEIFCKPGTCKPTSVRQVSDVPGGIAFSFWQDKVRSQSPECLNNKVAYGLQEYNHFGPQTAGRWICKHRDLSVSYPLNLVTSKEVRVINNGAVQSAFYIGFTTLLPLLFEAT